MNPTTPTAILLALAMMMTPIVAADDVPVQASIAGPSCVPFETDPTEMPPQVVVDPSCLKVDVLAPDL